MSSDKMILLVEDNPDDEALTIRAVAKKQHPKRGAIVAPTAPKRSITCSAAGAYAGRDLNEPAAGRPAGFESAQSGWAGSAAPHPGRRAHLTPAGGHPDLIEGGTGLA